MLDISQRRTFEFRGFEGWALQAAARLEVLHPGFLISTFHASSLKRQALFAVLADFEGQESEATLASDSQGKCSTLCCVTIAQLADTFAAFDARQMVEAAFGSCPRSYLILLAQLGAAPAASKMFYRTAFEVCSRADDSPIPARQ